MVNVLFVCDKLVQKSGVTSVVLNFLSRLNNENVHVDVVAYDDSEIAITERIKAFGSSVFFMPKFSIRNVFKFLSFFDNLLRENHYDVVHSHFFQIDNFVFPIAKKHGVKTCITHSHNSKLSDYPLRAIRNRILCLGLGAKADVWAACSEMAGVALFGKRFSHSRKKLIIHNGIDPHEYAFDETKRLIMRKQLCLSDDDIVIGNVAGFRVQKNQAFLVDVLSLLVKKNPHYKLVFVGDGKTFPMVKHKVEDKKLSDNVVFLGSRKDVPYLLNAFDLFALPSFYEGLPVVAIEAQASGLHCFLADTITRECDVTGITYLSINRTPELWASAISNINSHDRISNALSVIERSAFSIDEACAKLTGVYFRLSTL